MGKFQAFLASIAGKGLMEVGDHITGWIKTFVKTPQDKLELIKEAHAHELALKDKEHELDESKRLELESVRMFQQSIFALEIEDKKDARDMYKHDSRLQKIYAIFFLVGFFAIVVFLSLAMLYKNNVSAEVMGFLGTVFGAISARIGTITDFLFGASFKASATQTNTTKEEKK